jgi:acetyl-CoA carboxylase biotin carboxylase subunit
MFRKVLVANRGEIALRIIRACHEAGIPTVLVHSEADRDSLPVRLADETVCIGPGPAAKSYLNIPNIISAALITGADAVHPGTGFLAENPYFAEICEQCHLTFIGPAPETIERMGDKSAARELMRAAGLPVIPGTDHPLRSLEEALEAAQSLGYPVMLKAVAGGGGRGLRVISSEAELQQLFPIAQAEAQASFGNGQLYLEKLIAPARHVEVQILGDRYGRVIHLGTRGCSVQRRHQKLIEEAPAPGLSRELQEQICVAAVRGAAAISYYNAGTMEFLVDEQDRFYFMEMNTRLQVEHTVTEAISGIDLVKEQLRIAAGEPLGRTQEQLMLFGHAIECRITAEDPDRRFAPDCGEITAYLPPGGPGIRVDSHVFPGYVMPSFYDSLLAKLIAWGATRDEAIARMDRALTEYVIDGVKTSLPFHRRVMADPVFRQGAVRLDFVERLLEGSL